MFGRYVHKTGSGSYRFRIRVPVSLRSQFGATEIRESLGTDSLGMAQIMAAKLAALYKLEFLKMKQSKARPESVNIPIPALRTEERSAEQAETPLQIELITTLIEPDGTIRIEADFEGDIELETKATSAILRDFHATRDSDSSQTLSTLSKPKAAPKLSEAMTSFLKEKASGGNPLKPRSLEEYRSSLSVFVALHGDCSIFEVSRESVLDACEAYKKLPPYFSTKEEYRKVPLKELVLKNTEQMSQSSYSKFAVRVSMLFSHCMEWYHLPSSPAVKLVPKKNTRASDERNIFTTPQLKALFESDFYKKREFERKPYQYWVPIIALYSGARISEICQLRVQDIVREKGLLCFFITPEAGGLKTVSSARKIPVHSKLLSLGFEDYVASKLHDKQLNLFPEIPRTPGKDAGDAPSKWFTRYRRKCKVGAEKGSKIAFHSFRHTAIQKVSEADIGETRIDDVVGHKSVSIASNRYRNPYAPHLLVKTVEALIFDEICFTPWAVAEKF